MAIDNIRTQIERDKPLRPSLEQDVIDALKHKSIHEVAKLYDVSLKDIEEYVAVAHHGLQNRIIQNYQVYAADGSIPPPEMERHFPVHSREMHLTADEHKLFKQEMSALQAHVNPPSSGGGGTSGARAATTGSSSVTDIAHGALQDWKEFYSELQFKALDAQMVQQLQGKTAELNKEVQRIMSLVMSGQIDPEYVVIAAAKSNMLQNGTMFSWKGKRIALMNSEMDKIAKSMYKMDPNDQGYLKELQMSESKTRNNASQMQMEVLDINTISQRIGSTIEWANNAVKTFAQMRQTPTQAIAAR